nr:putative pentatricopeptide repeat-containing protein At3g25970 [Tanacetum cinerariifolium]
MLNVLKGLVLKVGFSGNVVLVSGFVQRFMKFGCLDSGVKSFYECHFGCLDNVIWSVVIHGYVTNGVYDKGRECFAKMLRFGFEFNEFCLSGVIGCVFDVREGEAIHGWCVKKRWLLGGFSMHLCNAIMVMYGRCGRRWDGVKLFDEMCEQDVVLWTGRIGVAFDCWDAFEVFKRCVLSGCEVNEFTLINVLASVEGGETVDMG